MACGFSCIYLPHISTPICPFDSNADTGGEVGKTFGKPQFLRVAHRRISGLVTIESEFAISVNADSNPRKN